MAVKNRKELFVQMLSNVRHSAERTGKIFHEMGQVVQDKNVKEALDARAFVSDKVLNTLDECFKVIGEQPVKPNLRLQEVFMEDFRREVNAIESPEAKILYVLSCAIFLNHMRIGEYTLLATTADMTGHYGLGVLLESCLADNLAFSERTRRFAKNFIEGRIAERRAA